MKCPKCGYHSFDHLESCKKCGQGLSEHKAKFNLRGFFFPGQAAAAAAPAPVAEEAFEDEETPENGAVDFGFDFLDAEEDPVGDSIALDDRNAVSIDQPFGADSETVPSDEKPGKGPEFAF